MKSTNEKKYFIVAGSQHQAHEYCLAKGIKFNERMIIHSAYQLKTLQRGGLIKLVGTYYMRKDWWEIEDLLKKRQWKTEIDGY